MGKQSWTNHQIRCDETISYTVKLIQGGTWKRRKLAQCEQILWSRPEESVLFILYNAETWPMWKIYSVPCDSTLNKFYCIYLFSKFCSYILTPQLLKCMVGIFVMCAECVQWNCVVMLLNVGKAETERWGRSMGRTCSFLSWPHFRKQASISLYLVMYWEGTCSWLQKVYFFKAFIRAWNPSFCGPLLHNICSAHLIPVRSIYVFLDICNLCFFCQGKAL
jgi:hypothetical protein